MLMPKVFVCAALGLAWPPASSLAGPSAAAQPAIVGSLPCLVLRKE
jgi:hypothetical protein